MKKTAVVFIFLFGISSLFSQNNNDSQNTGKNTFLEAAKEMRELYDQYKRTIKNVNIYWEEEIKTGLSINKYVNNFNDIQYLKISNIFDKLLNSPYLGKSLKKYNWRIFIQNSNTINAFSALDGIIIINRGIIDFCHNDDELALIIGHEMAHMTEDHIEKHLTAILLMDPIIENISKYIAQKKNKRIDTEEMSDKEISDKELFELIFGLTGELALLKYNRVQEEKADEIGAKYAASVGYDTDRGYDFWKRISQISNEKRWMIFLSTHPYSEQRALAFLNGDFKRKYFIKNAQE